VNTSERRTNYYLVDNWRRERVFLATFCTLVELLSVATD
jgi:hypothetical protein